MTISLYDLVCMTSRQISLVIGGNATDGWTLVPFRRWPAVAAGGAGDDAVANEFKMHFINAPTGFNGFGDIVEWRPNSDAVAVFGNQNPSTPNAESYRCVTFGYMQSEPGEYPTDMWVLCKTDGVSRDDYFLATPDEVTLITTGVPPA